METPWYAQKNFSKKGRSLPFQKVEADPLGKTTIRLTLDAAWEIVRLLSDDLDDPKVIIGAQRQLREAVDRAEVETAIYRAGLVLSSPVYHRNECPQDSRWEIIELLQPYCNDHEDIKRAYLILTGPELEAEATQPSDLDTDEDDGYVYLAHTSTGHYKVGRSKEPEDRIRHFDTKMPVAVTMMHSFPCDDYVEAERLLHQSLKHLNEKGEWFDLPSKAVQLIQKITRYRNGEWYIDCSSLNDPDTFDSKVVENDELPDRAVEGTDIEQELRNA